MPTFCFNAAIALVSLVLLASAAGTSAQTGKASQGAGTAGTPSLRIVLEKGLQARLPSEFAFVDRVVELVNDGELPVGMVDSTFLWARYKRPYPFPYFERALRIRAARIGILLPSVYPGGG